MASHEDEGRKQPKGPTIYSLTSLTAEQREMLDAMRSLIEKAVYPEEHQEVTAERGDGENYTGEKRQAAGEGEGEGGEGGEGGERGSDEGSYSSSDEEERQRKREKRRRKEKARREPAMGDELMLKFLVARNFDVAEASDMAVKALAWYRENQPGRLLDEAAAGRIAEVTTRKTVWWPHRDVFGRPVLICFAKRHFKSAPDMQQKIHHCLWVLESGMRKCLTRDGPGSYIVVLLDMANIGWENIDFAFYSNMVGLLQSFYPERVGAVFIFNAGWRFSAIWAAVRRWLDPRTTQKIFVNPPLSDVTDILPSHHLPKRFGGLLDIEGEDDEL